MMRPVTPRPYQRFTMRQVSYLRAHYADTPAPQLAAHFGVSVGQLYTLAKRHGITKRAPNGEPIWRQAA